MTHRYLHDLTEETSPEEKNQQGTERLNELSVFPASGQELPPLPPWYWRWPIRLWRLLPCTISGVVLFGILGAAIDFGGDLLNGLLQGMVLGAILGCFIDSRFALNGRMIDD